jgi:hypothetical protein
MKTFTPLLAACVISVSQSEAQSQTNPSVLEYTTVEPYYIVRIDTYFDNGDPVIERIPWVMLIYFDDYVPVRYYDYEGDRFPDDMIPVVHEMDCSPDGWKYYPSEWMQLRELKHMPPTYYYDEEYGSNGGYSLG